MGVLQWFVDLGPSVMLPVLLFIFGLILGTKPGKAFKAGLTVGIGFIGLNLVIGLLTDSLGPASKAMVENFGFSLKTIDVGWPAAAAISYGSALGSLAIPVGIGLNVLLLIVGLTRTLNVDIWDYWHCAFTGSLVYVLTGNFYLGLYTIAVHIIVIFFLGDLIAKDVTRFYKFPNITFPHGASAPSYLFALPLNWIFDRIPGFNKLKADPETIQKRLGIFGDTTVMGVLIGLVIGFLAGYSVSEVLQLAVQTGAVMLLMPRMVALLMEGLSPISEAASEFVRKRFPDRDLYIGMDSALSVGHPAVLSSSLLIVPITLFLAVILPGNTVLPFGDLATIPFLVCLMTAVFNGNIVRTVVAGTLYMAIGLLIASWAAPLITEAALMANFDIGDNNSISALVDGAVWTTLLFVGLAKLLSWGGISLIGAVALIGLIYLNKIKAKKAADPNEISM
jgi:galactitol PTS system EIIC component